MTFRTAIFMAMLATLTFVSSCKTQHPKSEAPPPHSKAPGMINATGALIVKQNPSHFYYKKKCEACGFVSDRVIGTGYPESGGAISTTFACPKCKKVQKVRIDAK